MKTKSYTDDQKRRVIELRRNGIILRRIAQDTGLSFSTVARICENTPKGTQPGNTNITQN